MATKDELETEKLLLEISELRRPWYKKPAYVFPTIVVVGTLLTGFVTQLFQAEFTKFENQKHDLQRDNETLVKEENSLNERIATLQRDKERLTSQSRELSSKSTQVADQLGQVNLQRKQLAAEKVRLGGEQARLEAEYRQKQLDLRHDLGTKTAEYAEKSAELDRQYEAQKKEINAKLADIQQRLVVGPVLSLIAEIQRNAPFESNFFAFKPNELVKLLLQNEEDRLVRLALVEDALAGADDPLFKSKLLYVMFAVTRQKKWKDQFVELIRSEPAKIPLTFFDVLTASAWDPKWSPLDTLGFWLTSAEPEMCELGIVVLNAHPRVPQSEKQAVISSNEATDKDKEIRRLTEQIDVGNRASMLYPCQRLRKPIESLNEFHDPQILLTGVRMARDQVLKEGNDMLGNSLEALYNLSRPAAFCVSMKLLTQLPRPKPAESPITNQLMLRNKAVSIAVEAEETTHGGRKFGGRTIHPSRWLRENRELATLWMENDLQTLRSKLSDVRLSLKQTVPQ